MVQEASAAIKAPLVMFTYFNPIMARGLDKFCRQAKEAGASGEGLRLGWAKAHQHALAVEGGVGAISCAPLHAAAAHLLRSTPPCVAAGLLVPDIPLEETPEIRKVAESHGLELVLLTTPTTPQVGCHCRPAGCGCGSVQRSGTCSAPRADWTTK